MQPVIWRSAALFDMDKSFPRRRIPTANKHRDFGVGISAADQRRIFTPYSSLNKRSGAGEGLHANNFSITSGETTLLYTREQSTHTLRVFAKRLSPIHRSQNISLLFTALGTDWSSEKADAILCVDLNKRALLRSPLLETPGQSVTIHNDS